MMYFATYKTMRHVEEILAKARDDLCLVRIQHQDRVHLVSPSDLS